MPSSVIFSLLRSILSYFYDTVLGDHLHRLNSIIRGIVAKSFTPETTVNLFGGLFLLYLSWLWKNYFEVIERAMLQAQTVLAFFRWWKLPQIWVIYSNLFPIALFSQLLVWWLNILLHTSRLEWFGAKNLFLVDSKFIQCFLPIGKHFLRIVF